MRNKMIVGAATAVLVVAIGARVIMARQVAESMDKPLAQFAIGDLFPKVDPGLPETAAAWRAASDIVKRTAGSRNRAVGQALPLAKARVGEAKAELKAAKEIKDQVAAGTAEGKVKAAETVVGILERMQAVASKHGDVADAWMKTADQLRRLTEIDAGFDRYRSSGLARPAAGQADARLDQDGYQALRRHAEALRDLGDAFKDFGQKMSELGSNRLKFAEDLDKGGQIRVR